ncbi:MAG: Flp family type IVb pilin [Alphaproteobacteria bacterium]|nr:Flp family type IVb pilin [Alphaproteobacteria bacterium]
MRLSDAGRRPAAFAHAARSALGAFAADNRGATAIEYALIASLISVVIVGSLVTIGDKLGTFFTSLASGFQ